MFLTEFDNFGHFSGQISDLHFLTIFGKNRKKTPAVKSDQKLKKQKTTEIWSFWA